MHIFAHPHIFDVTELLKFTSYFVIIDGLATGRIAQGYKQRALDCSITKVSNQSSDLGQTNLVSIFDIFAVRFVGPRKGIVYINLSSVRLLSMARLVVAYRPSGYICVL